MAQNRNLTLVDFQNDFVAPHGALAFENGKGDKALIQRMHSFLSSLPANYFTSAIITYDTHLPETYAQSEEGKQFPLHCALHSSGWQLAVDKTLIESKIPTIQYLHKNTYDMWAGTIDTVRSEIITPTPEVVLCGVASDICNRFALLGWLAQQAKIIVLSDLTRGIFKETPEVLQEKPFKQAVQRGQISLTTSQKFLNRITERSRL